MKVCNYTERSGFKNRGPGPFSVHLQGRIHHFLNHANSTDNSGGIGAFVFDNQCRKPLINVSYKRTFGAPDQGQMLDV